MSRLFFLNIVLVLLSEIGYSQNVYISRDVIGSYGGYRQTNSLIIMDNLGEIAVKIDSSSNLVLSQGFEQGDFTLSPVVLPISRAAVGTLVPKPIRPVLSSTKNVVIPTFRS